MLKNRLSSERGAMMVHVALIFIVVMAFSMIVVDYGVMWVSRNQAQNAADAGAHAGAVALAFDSSTDHSNGGPAKTAARSFATETAVFGERADVQYSDILFYSDAPSKFPPECSNDNCVRVDVYRTNRGGRTNPLPMFLGMFVGLNEQGVRATATAWAADGNASDCMKPWAVADRWQEVYPIPRTPDGFPLYTDTFDPDPPGGVAGDVYIPPSQGGTTSYQYPRDKGAEVRLKIGSPGDTPNPGWFLALDFDGYCPVGSNGSGADCYRDSISGCSTRTWEVGMTVPKENGNMVGPTGQGTQDLIDKDPDAVWNPVTKTVEHSCTERNADGTPKWGPCPGGKVYAQSPRIVPIPIFDLAHYLDSEKVTGQGDIEIINILGFFVDRVENPQNTIVGYLAATVGQVSGGGSVNHDASFLKVIQLVR